MLQEYQAQGILDNLCRHAEAEYQCCANTSLTQSSSTCQWSHSITKVIACYTRCMGAASKTTNDCLDDLYTQRFVPDQLRHLRAGYGIVEGCACSQADADCQCLTWFSGSVLMSFLRIQRLTLSHESASYPACSMRATTVAAWLAFSLSRHCK